jgi:hypothetical protein
MCRSLSRFYVRLTSYGQALLDALRTVFAGQLLYPAWV